MIIFDTEILDRLDVLVRTFWPYITISESGKKGIKEDAPENVKQAYEEYWEINNSFKLQS